MDIKKFVRKNILELKPYTSARSTNLNGILLDANENPYGSIAGESKHELNRYPDPNQSKLRNKLSEFLQIDKDNLFFGVGSDEIIDLLLKVFCNPNKDSVIICEPTYGMYNVSCKINDIEVINADLNENFDIEIPKILSSIKENTKLLFLCSPNNPTGNLLSYEKIKDMAKIGNLIIIIDEAYIDFANETESLNLIKNFNNVILLRTFSKSWGLAAARCGYCVADKEIIKLLFKVKAPYSINKLTEDIILQALDKYEEYLEIISLIKNERNYLIENLKKIEGVKKVFNSDSNFILFKVNNPKQVYSKLAENNIIIRDRSSQKNLEGCLRVSVGTREQNNLFLENLEKAL